MTAQEYDAAIGAWCLATLMCIMATGHQGALWVGIGGAVLLATLKAVRRGRHGG